MKKEKEIFYVKWITWAMGLFLLSFMMYCSNPTPGKETSVERSSETDSTGNQEKAPEVGHEVPIEAGEPEEPALEGAPAEKPGEQKPEGPPADVSNPSDQKIASLTFSEPKPWARPIEDYLAVGKKKKPDLSFLRGILDLVVYQDRMYIGYGDANINLGRLITIEMRYFASPEQNKAIAEFKTHEEQLNHFRILDGELYMPGVDATEDAWLGNVYIKRKSSPWKKSRTLKGGVHVHDCTLHKKNVYCVGSGANPDEWKQGKIFAHLWRSEDRGEQFKVFQRDLNTSGGDARWTRLLSHAGNLYLFGYKTNNKGVINTINHKIYDGKLLFAQKNTPLRTVVVFETDEISDALGLIRGVEVSKKPFRQVNFRIKDGKTPVLISPLSNQTVVDVYHHKPTGEVLVLSHDNAAYPSTIKKDWKIHVWLTKDLEQFSKVLSFTSQRPPKSIAYWRHYLFFGDNWGEIWRASAK